MKIGFVGVGNIGAPIAGQLLQAGHALAVHDLRREAAGALLAAGALWGDSPTALAQACEVVVTCLPGPSQMEKVCLGTGGLVAALRPGALYIDHTTNAPALVRRVAGPRRPRRGARGRAPRARGAGATRTPG